MSKKELNMSKKELRRNFILLLSLLFVCIAAAVAWYVAASRGWVRNPEFESVDAILSEIDTDGGYYNGIELSGYDVVLTPVSGLGEIGEDGRVLLYEPVIDPFTEAEPMDGAWQLATSESNEAEFDHENMIAYVSYLDYFSIIHTNAQAMIALSGDSFVRPEVSDYSQDPSKKSEYGDFSVDYIAGAVRIAFILCTPTDNSQVTGDLAFDAFGRLCNVLTTDEDGKPETLSDPIDFEEQLALIWIPNHLYQLTDTYIDVSGRGDMVLDHSVFTAAGVAESAYYYYDGTGKAVYPSDLYVTDLSGSYRTFANDIWLNPVTNNYSACIKVRIWVEGYDREASIALQGGKFESEIYLLAIQEAS